MGFNFENDIRANFYCHICHQQVKIRRYTKFQSDRRCLAFGSTPKNGVSIYPELAPNSQNSLRNFYRIERERLIDWLIFIMPWLYRGANCLNEFTISINSYSARWERERKNDRLSLLFISNNSVKNKLTSNRWRSRSRMTMILLLSNVCSMLLMLRCTAAL